MSTVLVTGARGFIGSKLALHLKASGCKVVGLGHGYLSPTDLENSGLDYWFSGDVNKSNLTKLASDYGQFKSIYHLAGGSLVGASFSSPFDDFFRTVVSTAELLEWVRISQPSAKVVVTSSAAVYGAGHDPYIKETDPKKPFSPYGANKSIQEDLCKSYSENFGLKIGIVRLFSVYGEGLQKQLIYELCHQISGEVSRISLQGTGTETRDWLHVNDVCNLLELVDARASKDCFIVNGGSGDATSIKAMTEIVCRGWGITPLVEFSGITRAGDPEHLVCDNTLALDIGFEPSITLKDGIDRVVDWHRATDLN